MEMKKHIISLLSVASMLATAVQPVGAAQLSAEVTEHQTVHSHHSSDECCNEEVYTGSGVKIAMLDTGVTDFTTAQYVSFVGDDEVLSDHGNDMAEILYNEVPDAEILDVRVLDNNAQGKYSDVNRGITWSVDNGADIIVMSFAGKEASYVLEEALEYAEENGVLVIASAGNYSSDNAVYPAAYPTVVSVGALDELGKICTYSNYGEIVDYFTYASEGTSSAAQYAAATAAQYMQESPEKSFEEIRDLLTSGKKKSFECASQTNESAVYAQACTSHSFNGSYTTTKYATCTATGTKVGKCTKCGKVVSTVTIPALGHNASSTWTTTKAATCTATGTRVKKCTRCSAVAKTETIAKSSHAFSGSYTTTKAATCTTAGTKVGKCTKCGTVVSTATIPALGHNASSTWTTTKAATCTATGTRVKKCTRCSAVAKTETIAKSEHTFNGSYTTTKAATCTASGTKVGKCTKCGKVVSTATIPALGHNTNSPWTTTLAATCTETGTRVQKCSRCSVLLKTETIEKSGHTFNGSYTTTKDATCTTSGTKIGKCTKCGTVVSTATIPALGHDTKSPWTYDSTGLHVKKCSRCSRLLDSETGHTFNGAYITTIEASCTTDGIKTGKCTKCGDVVSTVKVNALGHKYGEAEITKNPTKTQTGLSKQTCLRCGYVKTTVLEAIDVSIEDCSYSTFYFNALGQADSFIHSWAMIYDNAIVLDIQSNQDWTMTSASNHVKLTTENESSYKQVSGKKGKSRIMIKPDQLALNTKENFVSSITFKSGAYTKTYGIEQCTYFIEGITLEEYEKNITKKDFYPIIENSSAADYILCHKFTNGIVTGKCEGYNNYYYAVQTEQSEFSSDVYPKYIIYSVNKITDGNSQKLDIDVIEAHNMQIVKSGAPMVVAQGNYSDKMILTINTNDTTYNNFQIGLTCFSGVLGLIPKINPVTGLIIDLTASAIVNNVAPDNGQTPEIIKDGTISISVASNATIMNSKGHGMEVTLFSDENVAYSVNLTFKTNDRSASYSFVK